MLGSRVDLTWKKPSYFGGDGISVSEYEVMDDTQSIRINNSDMEVTCSESHFYDKVIVTAINSCGQKSEPAIIYINSSGKIILIMLIEGDIYTYRFY